MEESGKGTQSADINSSSPESVPEKSQNSEELIQKFMETYLEFLAQLEGTFPELVPQLKELANQARLDPKQVIEYFIQNIQPHFWDVSCKQDNLFKQEQLYLLPEIDFTQLWKKNITPNTRDAIWKYLQSLSLMGLTYVSQFDNISGFMDHLQSMMKDETVKPEVLQDLEKQTQAFANIMKNLQEPTTPKEEEDSMKETLNMLESSKIGQLAQELAGELKLEDLGIDEEEIKQSPPANMEEAFSKILGNNPMNLMSMVQNIGQKVQQKMSSGDISEADLFQDAQHMMSNLHKNPLFRQAFQSTQSMAGAAARPGQTETQERLRQKLQQRQHQQQQQTVAPPPAPSAESTSEPNPLSSDATAAKKRRRQRKRKAKKSVPGPVQQREPECTQPEDVNNPPPQTL